MPKIPPYSLEFRSEAVRLLRSSGRSVPQLARELGVSPQSLRNWSGQLDVDEGKAEGLSSTERDELRPVASRESGPRRGAGDPKKSGGLLRQGRRDPVSVYRFIAAEKAAHSIAIMCRVLEVSRSGYHAWTQRPLGPRAREDARLTERIRELHKKRRGVYGSPRIWSNLTVDDGERIGRKRVERLMRQAGLSGLITKKWRTTTVRVPGVRVAVEALRRSPAARLDTSLYRGGSSGSVERGALPGDRPVCCCASTAHSGSASTNERTGTMFTHRPGEIGPHRSRSGVTRVRGHMSRSRAQVPPQRSGSGQLARLGTLSGGESVLW
jgi:transposase-like protein